MNRSVTLALVVALLVVLAGCLAAPPAESTPTPDRDRTFSVSVTGNSSATYVVRAELVADPFENVTVTYRNGTERVVSAPGRNGAVSRGPESGVTGVTFRGEPAGGVYFEGPPAFSVTNERVASTGNAVVTVRQRGESVLAAWAVVRCDGHVSGVSFVATGSGVSGAGFSCVSVADGGAGG